MSPNGPSRPILCKDLTSAFGARRKWAARQSQLPRSKMTLSRSRALVPLPVIVNLLPSAVGADRGKSDIEAGQELRLSAL
jgi:hypothetical protein